MQPNTETGNDEDEFDQMEEISNHKRAEMDKVYRKYLEASKNPDKLAADLGIDASEADGLSTTATIRKEMDLNNEEKQFLLAVERGDVPKTRHFLQESLVYFNININCVDPLGRTALHIGIENENIELIELLLKHGVEVGDSLLHAINEENVEAVEMLLAHQAAKKREMPTENEKTAKTLKHVLKKFDPKKKSKEEEDKEAEEEDGMPGAVPSSSFTPDITPIILAAHRDNFEILKILLDRGDRIPKPHDIRCSCSDCKTKSSNDSLNHSRSRINAYRALSSPSLIALSSEDPILTSFQLSWELKRLSRLENEFKADYEKLALSCQDFGVDLLDQTRGSSELETILNYDPDGPVADSSGDGKTEERMTLARLKLAIKYKQKKFVAHPNCQQLLSSLWYKGLPGFRRRPIVFKLILIATVCCSFPCLSLMYLVLPKTRLGQFMRRPFIKFICNTASYLTFLFLLILASQRIESPLDIMNLVTGGSRDTSKKLNREVRGSQPTIIEWMIIAYVTGLIWAEVKQLWEEGAKAYVKDLWNILDFITNSLYIATFTLKLVAYIRVQQEKQSNPEWVSLPRNEWDAFDPNLISEGLFAAANIFSSLKLIYMFTVDPHLGPLQISLGRMVSDIMQFLLIAFLVIFSYGCGVNQLYWFYADERDRECAECLETQKVDPEIFCECDKSLSNLFEILQTLYFSIYGLVDIKHFEIKQPHDFTKWVGKTMFGTYSAIMVIVLINMLIAMLSNSYQAISILQTLYFSIYGLVDIKHFEIKQPHDFTQWVGKTMFGTYSAIMIIVLINMLIAMLSASYQIISDDADTEWKFARSKLWMSYFEEGCTVPAPFNVIPTPKSCYYIMVWVKDKLCHCTKMQKRSKWQSIRKLVKRVNEREARYQQTMRDLVKRYIMTRQRENQSEGVTEDDLNEIKQDISSFRYELLAILRENGMKLGPGSEENAQKSKNRMRRKGSRMSMERQMKDPIHMMHSLSEEGESDSSSGPQQSTFLSRVRKLGRTKSGTSTTSQDSTDTKDIPVTTTIKEQGSPGSKDEGLGESFEQNSESSEGSLEKRVGSDFSEQLNGVKNNQYDPVPEEGGGGSGGGSGGGVISDQTVNGGVITATNERTLQNQRQVSEELPLDANKLPRSKSEEGNTNNSSNGSSEGGAGDNHPQKLTKTVSFYGEGESGDKSPTTPPVSDTFVYKEKKGEKDGGKALGWFGIKRGAKK